MSKRSSRPLFSPQKKKHPGCLMGILIFLFILVLVFSLNAVNNSYVTLQKLSVSRPEIIKSYEGFSILHLSDLQGAVFGENQQRLYDQIRLENYQAVCLTGNMVGKSGNTAPLLDLLERIPDEIPVFLISGDEDPGPLNTASLNHLNLKADFIRQAEASGAIYLDSPRKVSFQGRNVWFSPVQLFLTDLKAASFALSQYKEELETKAQQNAADLGDVADLLSVNYQLELLKIADEARLEMKPDDVYVLLSHFPLDAMDAASLHSGERQERKSVNFPGSVSLILAGHWNNGQWRLPFVGPVYVPASNLGLMGLLPGDNEVSGLGNLYGISQYISPGLGNSGTYPWWMPMRLFNTPRMTLLTLTSALI